MVMLLYQSTQLSPLIVLQPANPTLIQLMNLRPPTVPHPKFLDPTCSFYKMSPSIFIYLLCSDLPLITFQFPTHHISWERDGGSKPVVELVVNLWKKGKRRRRRRFLSAIHMVFNLMAEEKRITKRTQFQTHSVGSMNSTNMPQVFL